jgi:hypothetical protein
VLVAGVAVSSGAAGGSPAAVAVPKLRHPLPAVAHAKSKHDRRADHRAHGTGGQRSVHHRAPAAKRQSDPGPSGTPTQHVTRLVPASTAAASAGSAENEVTRQPSSSSPSPPQRPHPVRAVLPPRDSSDPGPVRTTVDAVHEGATATVNQVQSAVPHTGVPGLPKRRSATR